MTIIDPDAGDLDAAFPQVGPIARALAVGLVLVVPFWTAVGTTIVVVLTR